MSWKLWIDDQIFDTNTSSRHPALGFTGAASSEEAQRLVIRFGIPEFLQLDHDLGLMPDGSEDRVTNFLTWLELYCYENGLVKTPAQVPGYAIHSANPVGRKNIVSFMESWKKSLELL